MPAPAATPPFAPAERLTERDLQPVKDLIDEVRRQEVADQLIGAEITWLNAFTQFKKTRNRHGLPAGESACRFYGMVLADLKATGKALLCCHEEKLFNLENAPVTKENFVACVRELECDDVILDMGLLNSGKLADVAAALGAV